MSDNPILDELFAAREKIFRDCGGSLKGLCSHYAKRRPGVLYADLKPVKPRRPSARTARSSARKSPSPAK